MHIINLSGSLIALAAKMPLKERVFYSLRVSVIGMAAVFGVLILIWGVLVLLRIIVQAHERKKSRNSKTAADADKVSAASEELFRTQDDGELTAVIMAAISAMLEEESRRSGTLYKGFKVVSFKRSENIGNRK